MFARGVSQGVGDPVFGAIAVFFSLFEFWAGERQCAGQIFWMVVSGCLTQKVTGISACINLVRIWNFACALILVAFVSSKLYCTS